MDTVLKAKKIINDFGIILTENWIESGISNCYSVRVEIINTNVGTNGKGVTKLLAMASAYAEFLERFQNGHLFTFEKDKDMFRDVGFISSPDEIAFDISTAYEKGKILIDSIIDFNGLLDDKGYYNKFLELSREFDVNELKMNCLPFYNLIESRMESLPVFLRSAYGTNGMCAGNTREEALVQGISEVFERYVHVRILKDGLSMPDVPLEFIKEKFPEVYNMIVEIKSSDRYDVIVKDCSMSRKLPVCASIIIDKQNQSYMVHLGSHPDLGIAIERTITESFQGRNLDMFNNEFSLEKSGIHISENIIGHLTVGVGEYPNGFFMTSEEKFDEELYSRNWISNEEMLEYYLVLCKGMGLKVLVRDCTILDFPAYHVVIPSFSEVFPLDELIMARMKTLKIVRKTMKNLKDRDRNSLELVLEYINYNIRLPHNIKGLKYYYGMPINTDFEGGSFAELYFLMYGYAALGKYEKSVDLVNILLKLKSQDSEEYLYLKAIKELLYMMSNELDMKVSNSAMAKFYSKGILEKAVSRIETVDTWFYDYYSKDCNWKCDDCYIKGECDYPQFKNIMMKFRNYQIEKNINQESCNVFRLCE
jgi:ribosomal protein S12 methylthiotransferase accessory factor